MKENWTVENHINDWDLFIIVSNYEPLNEIHNWGFKESLNKSDNDIGVWKIKQKK